MRKESFLLEERFRGGEVGVEGEEGEMMEVDEGGEVVEVVREVGFQAQQLREVCCRVSTKRPSGRGETEVSQTGELVNNGPRVDVLSPSEVDRVADVGKPEDVEERDFGETMILVVIKGRAEAVSCRRRSQSKGAQGRRPEGEEGGIRGGGLTSSMQREGAHRSKLADPGSTIEVSVDDSDFVVVDLVVGKKTRG